MSNKKIIKDTTVVIAKNCPIKFKLKHNGSFELQIDKKGELYIRSFPNRLEIYPQASNVVRIKMSTK